jgi:hypothetical protein
MEIKHMHIMIALTIIFLGALYFFLDEASKPSGPTGAEIAESLHMKATALGENSTQYTYGYTEYSNGYPEDYFIMSDSNNSLIKIISPLSTKKVYLLENDTILCIELLEHNVTCQSVKNNSITEKYIEGLKTRLFSKGKIALAKSDARYRIDHNFQNFSDEIKTKTLPNNDECVEISYQIDYSNASFEEMQRFNIVPGSPMHFDITACIDNQTGEIYENKFEYIFNGKEQTYFFKLISSDFDNAPTISPPTNLSNETVDLAILESGYRIDLINCYLKSGSEQEKCIATEALKHKYKDLCSESGSRKDRCLVSIVPLTKDVEICSEITNQDFLDDCNIELAGAYKNSTYCDLVDDSTKKQFCFEISGDTQETPIEINNTLENITDTNLSINDTQDIPKDVKDIIKEMENNTNSTG